MSGRIVISGIGVVSPLGHDRVSQWKGYGEGKSDFIDREIDGEMTPLAPLSSESSRIIEELKSEKSEYRSVDRTVLMAIAAARLAMKESGWERCSLGSAPVAAHDVGIFIGSSRGATHLLEESYRAYLTGGPRAIPVATSPLTTLGNIATWVAQDISATSAAISHSVTCSTALHAIGNAIAWIRAGMGDRFLVGGAEAPLTPFTIAQMKALRIYSEGSASDLPCRPFAREVKRAGTLTLGEGACVFAVEREDTCIGNPIAIIEGFGTGVEQIDSSTSISREGTAFQRAMRSAIAMSGESEGIDLVVMHAPGTRGGDESERTAVNEVFGEKPPSLVAPKWIFGHTFGASGAFGIDFGLSAIATGKVLPPPYQATLLPPAQSPKRVLINAAGFGGNAASVVISVR